MNLYDDELTQALLWPQSAPSEADFLRSDGSFSASAVTNDERSDLNKVLSENKLSAASSRFASSSSSALDTKTVKTPSMEVNLAGIRMKNPLNTASGTFGYGWQFEKYFDVACLGAITTKGCSVEPWKGNPAPRYCTIKGGMINSVGLQNPGIKGLIEGSGAYLEKLASRGCAVICQIAAHTIEEYVRAVEIFEEMAPWAAGLELNVSCPNISGGCALGSSPEGAAQVVRACRNRTKRPLLIKMAPVRIPEIAQALEAAGADALSVVNSIPGMAIDINTGKSRLSRPTGGMSGPCLHHVILRMVWEAHKACSLPINAVGGVVSYEDAAEFILAGATSVSLGYSNLLDPWSAPRILDGLTRWVQRQNVNSVTELIGAFDE